MRLASLNLFSGRGPDGRPRPGLPLGGFDADVLALQEVDVAQPRSGSVDQAAEVAATLGLPWWRFEPALLGTPGEAWVPVEDRNPVRQNGSGSHPAPSGAAFAAPGGGPAYGVALLSRLPVRAWHTLRLAPSRGRFPMPIPSRPPQLLWLRDEPRVALAAELDGLTVACTHLSFVPGVNVRQLRKVVRWLETLPGPRYLLGDLNLPGRMPARLTGWTSLVEAPTFPAVRPRLQLDHVLAHAPVPASGRAFRLPVGDHLAVAVDLL